MAWLVVLGNGSWSSGNRRFTAGKHLVDDELAERARAAGLRMLVVLDEEPELQTDAGSPLKLEHVRRGSGGVKLRQPELAPEPDEILMPNEYRCVECTTSFPSQGALVRHVEFHHAVLPEQREAAAVADELPLTELKKKGARARKKQRVIARDGGICWICGKPGANTVDHLVPESKGGTDALTNLRAAHDTCNHERGNDDMTAADFAKTSVSLTA